MAVTGLNHINFHGPRPLLDVMRDFYCDVIGLVDGPRPPFAMFGYWLYAADQPIVHLYESREDEKRHLGIPVTFDHFAFSCDNADETEERLKALGAAYRVTSVPDTAVKQIFLHDPAGNRVELQFGDR